MSLDRTGTTYAERARSRCFSFFKAMILVHALNGSQHLMPPRFFSPALKRQHSQPEKASDVILRCLCEWVSVCNAYVFLKKRTAQIAPTTDNSTQLYACGIHCGIILKQIKMNCSARHIHTVAVNDIWREKNMLKTRNRGKWQFLYFNFV